MVVIYITYLYVYVATERAFSKYINTDGLTWLKDVTLYFELWNGFFSPNWDIHELPGNACFSESLGFLQQFSLN